MKVNYSLYNLALSTADFSKCTTSSDAMREMFHSLYPHIDRLIKENISLRNIVAGSDKSDNEEYVRISMIEADLNKWAKRLLEKGRKQYLSAKRMKLVDGEAKELKA